MINPKLVRGLDYCKTVFEWTTDKLGSQATVCAGGRYDGLLGQIKSINSKSDKATSEPAVGFAMGLERLLLLLQTVRRMHRQLHVMCLWSRTQTITAKATICAQLRQQRPTKSKNGIGHSMKAQMKKADKSGCDFDRNYRADEVEQGMLTVKTQPPVRAKSHAMHYLTHQRHWSSVGLIRFFVGNW